MRGSWWGAASMKRLAGTLQFAEAGAGVVEFVVFFGEAEAEEVFAAAGAEEGAAGDCGDSGGGEEIAGFEGGGFSGQVIDTGQHIVSAGGNAGLHSGIAQSGEHAFALGLVVGGDLGVEVGRKQLEAGGRSMLES